MYTFIIKSNIDLTYNMVQLVLSVGHVHAFNIKLDMLM